VAIDRGAADYLYVQLANHIREQITTGQLPGGSKLPTLIDLAAQYDVAEMTVRKALRLLADEGVVVTRPGRGVVVA
jgi:DNA-binding GntR family transcriptional regulator